MKTYTQFIKEVNYSVYGQATLGSKPGTATNQQIKSGVDRAIKNIGTGKGSGQIGQKGGFGLSGGVNVSMTGSSSKSPTPTPTTTKTPPPTKIKPDKTKDPKPPNEVKTTTSTSSPSTNVLIKGSSTSSTSTSTSTSTQSPTKIRDPRTARISDMRMGRT